MTTESITRIALVGGSDLVRCGLAAMLAPQPDLCLLPAPRPGEPSPTADLTLYDVVNESPEQTLTGPARRPGSGRPVLYYSPPRSAVVSSALLAGVSCLSHDLSAPVLLDCLRRIAAGETVIQHRDAPADAVVRAGLTGREAQMVALIATGVSNQAIAEMTHLSINSVKSYIRGAYGKIAVESRAQAVLWAVNNDLVGQTAS